MHSHFCTMSILMLLTMGRVIDNDQVFDVVPGGNASCEDSSTVHTPYHDNASSPDSGDRIEPCHSEVCTA